MGKLVVIMRGSSGNSDPLLNQHTRHSERIGNSCRSVIDIRQDMNMCIDHLFSFTPQTYRADIAPLPAGIMNAHENIARDCLGKPEHLWSTLQGGSRSSNDLRAGWQIYLQAQIACNARLLLHKILKIHLPGVGLLNRMGNGPPESGDGWKYRGNGPPQLTGADNHRAFAEAIGKSVDDAVAYIGTLEGGIEAAAWFWEENDINRLADTPGVADETKRINGGTVGIEDRQSKFNTLVDELLAAEKIHAQAV